MAMPKFLVDRPVREQLPYGLFSAATVIDNADPRIFGGVEYETDPCGPATPNIVRCYSGSSFNKTLDGQPAATLVSGEPFMVYTSYSCRPREDGFAFAERRLVEGEQYAVEEAFQQATLGLQPTLKINATVLTTTPQDPIAGIGALEQRLGQLTIGGGIIHAPRQLAPYMAMWRQTERQGNTLRTALGTKWAFGGGYSIANSPGAQPAPAAGTYWIYGSGPVVVHRTEVIMSPPRPVQGHGVFDPVTNIETVLAERVYALTVECGIYALPITVCGACPAPAP